MSDHDTADRALLSRVEAKQAAWRGEPKFIPTEWVWELAAALARRIAEGEWQPIETAPRGSHVMILLHAPYSQRGPVDYGYFDMRAQRFMVQTMLGWEPLADFGCEPTHWMPLPAAPIGETEAP